MAGFNVCEQGHVVNILPPVDLNGGKTSDYFSLKDYSHASIILTIGVNAGAASTITVEESDDNAGNDTTPIAFDYAKEETAAGDTLGELTSATTDGFATHVSNSSLTYVIEIDDTQLSDGYPYLCVKASSPGASVIGSMVAVLSGSRYAGATTPTATD
jgi:hypothetical protein